jgi:hypothetical protein
MHPLAEEEFDHPTMVKSARRVRQEVRRLPPTQLLQRLRSVMPWCPYGEAGTGEASVDEVAAVLDLSQASEEVRMRCSSR